MSERVCPTCGTPAAAGTIRCPKDGTALPISFHEPSRVRDPLVGQTIGEYQVEEQIGGGGMGIVYRAVQPVIGKTVAIKVLRPEIAADPDQMRRFLAEARAVNAIHHRGIVDIFSLGKLADGRQYLVMEYLEGKSLDRVIAEEAPMLVEEVLSLLEDVLDALAAAHAAGVVHRDLKPNNIFVVCPPSGNRYVKLFDFGLAMVRNPDATSALGVSVLIGTPEYMSPEQALGEMMGPRTDLYALGVIAFEMLTGRLPLRGETVFDTIHAQVNLPAPRVSSLQAGVPGALDELVEQLLRKKAEERPESASTVRRALSRLRNTLHSQMTRQIPALAPPRELLIAAPNPAWTSSTGDSTDRASQTTRPRGTGRTSIQPWGRPAIFGAVAGVLATGVLVAGAISLSTGIEEPSPGISPMRTARPTPGEPEPDARWRADTLARLAHVESELRRRAPRGASADADALQLVGVARDHTMDARTARDRKNVTVLVGELERRLR